MRHSIRSVSIIDEFNYIINVEDLRIPVKSLHEYKTFRDCKFVGPGALVIVGGTLKDCMFHGCGDVLTIPDGTFITGLVVLKDCIFESCDFSSINLLIPRSSGASLEASMPNMKVQY